MSFGGLITLLSNAVPGIKLLWAPTEQDENIATIIREFLRDHDMICTDYPSLCDTNKELENLMQTRIEEFHGLPTGQANQVVPLHLSASLIEVISTSLLYSLILITCHFQLAYHECSLAEKLNIALLNWYLLYIDNESPKDVTPFIPFQERFFKNLPQIDPFLDGLASCLHAMFDLYPALFASLIVDSILDYMVAICAEPLIKAQPQNGSTRFPTFLRERTGAGPAFAMMMFPNSLQPVNYVTCFQALADMDFWVTGANDLLSYHKENVAGETANYISVRANAEAKTPLKVTSDIRKELLRSRKYIYTIFSNAAEQKAVRLWRVWEHGYITWHLQRDRYMLRELPLGL